LLNVVEEQEHDEIERSKDWKINFKNKEDKRLYTNSLLHYSECVVVYLVQTLSSL